MAGLIATSDAGLHLHPPRIRGGDSLKSRSASSKRSARACGPSMPRHRPGVSRGSVRQPRRLHLRRAEPPHRGDGGSPGSAAESTAGAVGERAPQISRRWSTTSRPSRRAPGDLPRRRRLVQEAVEAPRLRPARAGGSSRSAATWNAPATRCRSVVRWAISSEAAGGMCSGGRKLLAVATSGPSGPDSLPTWLPVRREEARRNREKSRRRRPRSAIRRWPIKSSGFRRQVLAQLSTRRRCRSRPSRSTSTSSTNVRALIWPAARHRSREPASSFTPRVPTSSPRPSSATEFFRNESCTADAMPCRIGSEKFATVGLRLPETGQRDGRRAGRLDARLRSLHAPRGS